MRVRWQHLKNKKMKLRYIFLTIIILFKIQGIIAQNETENWKLFISNENHFSIKFPDYCTEIITSGQISDSLKAMKKNMVICNLTRG